MSGKNINFGDKKIEKSYFYKNKKILNIHEKEPYDPKKEPYDTKKALKCFIGYNDNDVIRPLCLRLLQMTGYTRKFDKNVNMSLRNKDE